MGDPRTTLAQRETMLRRVALVLSSLPAPAASRILSQVDPESRNLVHQAVAVLSNVPASERSSALESFVADVRVRKYNTPSSQPIDTSGVQDEIVLGESHGQSSSVSITPFVPQFGSALQSKDGANEQVAHFAFLRDAGRDELTQLLSGERPQTIALVMASISPKQAADVLPRLDAELQSQTLNRIGRLEEVADATAAAVAEHLRSRFKELIAKPNAGGSEALRAIISELPHLAKKQREPVEQTSSLKLAEGTWPSEPNESKVGADAAVRAEECELTQDAFQPIKFQSAGSESVAKAAVEDSAELIHGYLVDLPPKTLVESLGRVGTRDALLTLCGLPNATSEAAIALLSRAKAKAARQGMTQLGSLRLTDIDDAKHAVAMAAKNSSSNVSPSAARRRSRIAA